MDEFPYRIRAEHGRGIFVVAEYGRPGQALQDYEGVLLA